MAFQPYPTRSGFISLGVTVVAGLVAVLLLDTLLQQTAPPPIFGLLLGFLVTMTIFLAALYWTVVAFRLQYQLNRNGLAIQWGPSQYLVPFEQIKAIIPGHDCSAQPTFKGINLAGLRVGRGDLAEYGVLKFHTTAPFADSLLVVTADQSYIISPDRPADFIKAWQRRQSVGTTQQWQAGLDAHWPLNLPLFTDRLAQLFFGLSLLICLALFGYLTLIYADLPASLPIRFDALGQPDRIAAKSTLAIFPAVGVVVLGLNTLLGIFIYTKEKIAAHLLWGSTVILELSLWVALLQITA